MMYPIDMNPRQIAFALAQGLLYYKVTDDEWLAHRYAQQYEDELMSGQVIDGREELCVAFMQGPWHPDIGEGALRVLLHMQAIGVKARTMQGII